MASMSRRCTGSSSTMRIRSGMGLADGGSGGGSACADLGHSRRGGLTRSCRRRSERLFATRRQKIVTDFVTRRRKWSLNERKLLHALPQLMEIFGGGDEVVRFDPPRPQDVAAAEQETDYVNQ